MKKRPKIEVFANCLPGKIAFTDVDGLVEINSNFLFLEWKDHRGVGAGQRILFERLTSCSPSIVFIVEGDAEIMEVESIAVVCEGIVGEPAPASIGVLCEKIREWVKWANWNPVERLQKMSDHPFKQSKSEND